MKTLTALLVCASLVLLFQQGVAFSADKQKEFEAIGKMNTAELVARAKPVLEKKYPNEDWGKYHFPKFVYVNEETTLAYKIAVKEHDLLSKFHCYCYCEESLGHKNLTYCLFKGGKPSAGFDSHASGCSSCALESITAFLWNDLGIDLPKMQAEMKRIYGHEHK